MLKFFSARDDENESLLGAITEGKIYAQCSGVWMLYSPFIAYMRYRMMILRVCLSQKTADTAPGCAHSPHHLCVCVCVNRLRTSSPQLLSKHLLTVLLSDVTGCGVSVALPPASGCLRAD